MRLTIKKEGKMEKEGNEETAVIVLNNDIFPKKIV
jgi:hypothetical protein